MSRAEDDKRWLEFRNRCAETVKKIQVLEDDGHYAQIYARDVSRLIAMLDNLDPRLSGEEPPYVDLQDVFEMTGEVTGG